MSFDRLLVFIAVGMTTLLIGGMGGLWIGARSEENDLLGLLAHGKFSDQCKQEVATALQAGSKTPGP
jgi:hypothetical protein